LTLSALSSRLPDNGQLINNSVTQCEYTCQHQQTWGSCTQLRRWTMETVHNEKLCDELAFLGGHLTQW